MILYRFRRSNNFELPHTYNRLLCHRVTFYKRLKQYQTDGVVPNDNDYGIKVGAPPIILKENIPKLNESLKEYKGFTENNEDLIESIVAVSDVNKRQRGDYS